jgi:hypothetical protein
VVHFLSLRLETWVELLVTLVLAILLPIGEARIPLEGLFFDLEAHVVY